VDPDNSRAKKSAPDRLGAQAAETPGAVGAARSASLSRRILCVLTDYDSRARQNCMLQN